MAAGDEYEWWLWCHDIIIIIIISVPHSSLAWQAGDLQCYDAGIIMGDMISFSLRQLGGFTLLKENCWLQGKVRLRSKHAPCRAVLHLTLVNMWFQVVFNYWLRLFNLHWSRSAVNIKSKSLNMLVPYVILPYRAGMLPSNAEAPTESSARRMLVPMLSRKSIYLSTQHHVRFYLIPRHQSSSSLHSICRSSASVTRSGPDWLITVSTDLVISLMESLGAYLDCWVIMSCHT